MTQPSPQTAQAKEAGPAPVVVDGSNRALGNKTLYVADLAPNVTESILLEVFSKVGQNAIQSIRVCRDSATGQSLGYAYVNFHEAKDCDSALENLNFEPINGRQVRLLKSNRDPSVRKSGVGNLFVKNLAADIDHAMLYDLFGKFGEIISCKVATDKITGESRGYGFVHFAKPQDAAKAIDAINGKRLNEKQVYVGKFIPKNQRPFAATSKWTNIYLKFLNRNLTQDQFAELLSKATADLGEITSPKLMVEPIQNADGTVSENSKGFGFVNFKTHEAAVAALERFQDDEKVKELVPELVADGEKLYANKAMSKTERNSSVAQDRNLFVKNIAESVTDEKFKEIFEYGPNGKTSDEKHFGNVTSAVIMKDENAPNGLHKGFGFVCYETKESAAKALAEMHGYRLENKPLYVAIAQPKEARRRQLQQFYNRGNMSGVPVFPGYPFVAPQIPGRYPGPTRPNFAQRGRVHPAFGRGGPMPGRPGFPPSPMVQMGGPAPPPAPEHFYAEILKAFPENEVSQKSADLLCNILVQADGLEQYQAKTIVGNILSEGQGKPIQQTIDHVQLLCQNQQARRLRVQATRVPAPQH